MTAEERKVKEDNWKYRRVAVFGSLGFLGAVIAYLAIFGESANLVQQMAMQSLPLLAGAVIMTYIGAPIADDWVQLRVNKS